jgi:hypothetical protein
VCIVLVCPPVADAVELPFFTGLKHCANGVIVFPILGHLSTRPGHASGFQSQNQQNFDLPGCRIDQQIDSLNSANISGISQPAGQQIGRFVFRSENIALLRVHTRSF